ncbi:VanW family protein [Virgibacillus necropolis]|uniref:VanW family protein n=1 Tax=Virgibacillus necropolis TaxID=163877 RepID=UPI0038504CEA
MNAFILSLFLFMVPLGNTPQQLTVTEKGKTLETVELERFELPYLNSYFINDVKLKLLLDSLDEKIYKEPINATLNKSGEIVQEKLGIALDRRKFHALFLKSFYLGEPVEIKIPKKDIFPRVDTELLAEIKEKEIGRYVTYFKKHNKERSHNIKLATEAINNYVVFPGEKFSFNKIVGERTEEKGYKKAPVIVKGELAEDIGGGICQVSSTLYNAVSLKGVKIVERYSHSRSVPYVPPGRDATVSWWGPDFVFKNMYNQPILIRAKSVGGRMDIGIFSSNTVELYSGK